LGGISIGIQGKGGLRVSGTKKSHCVRGAASKEKVGKRKGRVRLGKKLNEDETTEGEVGLLCSERDEMGLC